MPDILLIVQMCRPLLLECSTREVREVFGKLLEKTMSSFFLIGGIAVCNCNNICISHVTFSPKAVCLWIMMNM